ncbi:MAG: shikimate kinase [Actinomycetes bacterium]
MSEESSERHLVLVGLMGSGKSSVGALCAKRLERKFVDTDHMVEAAAGISVARIFATRGENEFRELERVAVSAASASEVPLVISCGGGVAVDPVNRQALRESGYVVWLDAPIPELAERATRKSGARPLLADGDPVATLQALAEVRYGAYESMADVRIDTAGLAVSAVADLVIEAFIKAIAE